MNETGVDWPRSSMEALDRHGPLPEVVSEAVGDVTGNLRALLSANGGYFAKLLAAKMLTETLELEGLDLLKASQKLMAYSEGLPVIREEVVVIDEDHQRVIDIVQRSDEYRVIEASAG